MFGNSLGSERFPVVAAIDPDVYTTGGGGAYSSGWVDMASYDRLVAIVMAGDMGASGTIDFRLQGAVEASPLVGVNLASKSITQLTQAGTDSNKQAIINLSAREMVPETGYRYAKAVMTIGTQTSDAGAVILGLPKYGAAEFGTALGSELIAVCGAVDPDAYAPATVTTGWVDASRFGRFLAVVMAGTTGTTNTVAAKLEQANTAAGGGAKDVSGKTITTVDGTTSPTTADVQRTIDCRADELDVANDFRWVRLSMTIADTTSPETATSDAAGLLLGLDPRFAPASDYDATSVDEIVA